MSDSVTKISSLVTPSPSPTAAAPIVVPFVPIISDNIVVRPPTVVSMTTSEVTA